MNTKQADFFYVANTYGRFDVALQQGSGAGYVDEDGKAYIDFGSGIAVNTFGSCDPEWVVAVTAQLNTMGHTSNLYYSAPQARLAQMLCEKTGMKKVFFGNSGAEANECALKIARKYGESTGRSTIVTLKSSFHGRTIATLAATGQDKFHEHFGPFPGGFEYITPGDEDELTAALTSGQVCGILMEMVQGEGGVNVLDKSYVQLAAKLCRENDVLFMVDEVQTGNGRTGKLFGFMHYDVQPDVFTTAKGLAGGLPMGACVIGEKAENVLGKGDHGSTFGGNPICAAGAVNVLSRLTDEMLEEVTAKGEYIRQELENAPGVNGITGLGLMLGISTEKPNTQIAADCLRSGLLVLTAKDKVRLLPPLNISFEALKQGIAILKENL
ncbi:MAG: acetylornithine/succinylornithine family transaminase [Clostridiales bacterium]|nr:acetylornithine/succinylornithine family transaminase [Clostridiales bacterium]